MSEYEKPVFNIISSNPPIKIQNVNYFISKQTIDDNPQIYIVIKKQGVNPDGSMNGKTKQIFIREEHKELFNHILSFTA